MFVSPLPMPPAMGWPMTVVMLITTAYLVLVAPVRGRRSYRRLLAARETDPMAVTNFYRRNVGRKWLLAVPVALAFIIWPGLRPASLGLAWPSGPYVTISTWFVVYVAVILAASVVVMRRRVRRGRTLPGLARIRAMVPGPTGWGWAFAAFTSASIVEELVYRGLLVAAGLSLGLSATVCLILVSAAFGLAHLYQGPVAVVLTGLLGFVLGDVLVLTGSLLLAVVLHFLVDMRALVVFRVVASIPAEPATSSTQDSQRSALI
jgi:membrane protease YdiL (CAAX protease family)